MKMIIQNIIADGYGAVLNLKHYVVIRNIALDNPKISIFLNCSHWAVHWSQLTGSGCVFGCESAFGVVSSSIGKLIGDIVLSTSTDKMKTDCKKVKETSYEKSTIN